MTTTKVYIGAVGEAFNSVIDARNKVAAAEKAFNDAQTLQERAQEVYDKAFGLSDSLQEVLNGATDIYHDLETALQESENNQEVHAALENLLNIVHDWDKDDRVIEYDANGNLVDGGNIVTQGANITAFNDLLNDVSDNLNAAKGNVTTKENELHDANEELTTVENEFKGMVPDDIAQSLPAPETGDTNKDIAAETERIDKELDHIIEVSEGVHSTTDWIAEQLGEIEGDTGDDSQDIDDDPVEPGEPWYYYVTDCGEEDNIAEEINNNIAREDTFMNYAIKADTDSVELPVRGQGWFAFIAPVGYYVNAEMHGDMAEQFHFEFDPNDPKHTPVFEVNGIQYKVYYSAGTFSDNEDDYTKVTITRQ